MQKEKKEVPITNEKLLEEIVRLKRMVETTGRDWHKIIVKRGLCALLLAFLACLVCLVVLASTIQNFRTWKLEIEQISVEQSQLTKEVVRTIKDMSWIHMQRLMISDLLNLSKLQIEDMKKIKEYKRWEAEQKKKEAKNGKRNTKQNGGRHPNTDR